MPSWKKVITSGSDACLNSLSVDSTTVVTNLNADKVDGCDASAFYLATNPDGFTTCTGTVTGTGVANNVAYWTSAGEIAADEGCLYWDPSSNELGIGTSTPGAQLHIYRNDTSTGPSLRIEQDGSGDALMQFTLTGANLWNVGIDNSNGDALTFARGTFSTGLETLVLRGSNVGIGNTNPPEALTVEGNISGSGTITVGGNISGCTLTSTVTTGTAPLTVTSTTVVTNLNADLLDGLHKESFYLASNPNNYTSCLGDITSVTALEGLTGTALSGDVNLCLALNELSSGTIVSASGIDASGNNANTALDCIDVGTFNNDVGYLTSDFLSNGADNRVLTATGTDGINAETNLTFDGSTLTVTGDTVITGTITAQEFKTELVSASIIYQSGSTKFGDTSDDVHSFSGSFRVTGSGDHYFTDGNVGIGITSPLAKLHINTDSQGDVALVAGYGSTANLYVGTTTQHTRLRIASASYHHQFFTRTSGGTSLERVRITGGADTGSVLFTNTQVGVNLANFTTDSEFEVRGDITIQNKNGSNPSDAGTLYFAESGNTWGTDYYGFRINHEGSNNLLAFQSANLTTVQNILTLERDSGEVGIGTTSPGAKLDVRGSAVFNEDSADVDFRVESNGNANMLFVDGGNDRVGIGTNAPAKSLQIGAGTFGYASTNGLGIASTSNPNISIRDTDNNVEWDVEVSSIAGKMGMSTNHPLNILTNNTERIHITSAGNVGIGTTSPSQPLTVEGNISGSGLIYAPNIGTGEDNSVVVLDSDGTLRTDEIDSRVWGSTLVDGAGTANHIAYWTDSNTLSYDNNQLYWDPSSNELGIGTNSPGAQLHIYRNDTSVGPSLRIEQDGSGDALMQFVMTGANLWNVGIDNSNGDALTFARGTFGTGTDTLVLRSSNVGIGNSIPPEALTVEGNISGSGTLVIDGNTTLGNATSDLHTFNGDIISNVSSLPTLAVAGNALNIDGNGGGAFGMFTSDGSSAGWLSFFGGGGATMYYKSGTSFCLGTSTAPGGGGYSTKFTFDTNGNLGIGNTPSAKLDVSGNSIFRGSAVFNEDTADVDFRVESNNNANMLFVDGGTDRVGIGTNAPEQIFHVDGGVNNAWGIFKKSSGTTGHLGFYGGGNQSVLYALRGGTFEFGTSTASSGTGYKAIFEVDANDNLVVNEDGDSAIDFRVESDTNTHMLFVDAGTNRVGIGTNSTSETLTVKGNTEVSGSIISPNFSAGLLGGDGYRLALSDTVGCTALEVDNLLVRGRLSVVEFLAQQIRATNGTLFVTSTGKVETVTTSGLGPYTACITTPTGSNHGFAVNDRIRAQRFDGFGNVYQSDLTVTAVPNPFAFTASYEEAESQPQPGFEYVRLGNSSDTDRQGGIILSSDLDDSPYIKIYDEVDEHNDIFTAANTKVLVGNLSSHNSTTFGCLSGSGGSPNYGFYASGSAYLEGSINATGGEIGGITICNTSISASNGGFEIKSDGSATFASGQITFESDGDITSNEYLVERSRVFGDGSDGCYTINTGSSSVAGLFNVTGTGFVTACLLRDAYFCNLTITGTSGCFVYIKTNGYRMFVKDTLTVCSYGFIEHNGSDGGNGSNAVDDIAGAGGSGGIGAADGNILGGTNGGAGGYGGESP